MSEKEVEKAAGSLKQMLGELDQENKKLTEDLKRKQKERVLRLKEAKALRQKMTGQIKNLDQALEKGKSALSRQTQAMSTVRKAVREQEQALHRLLLRLEKLEGGLRTGKVGIPDARKELLRMLDDLQGMRKQREKIMASAEGMVNASNFPTFRLDR